MSRRVWLALAAAAAFTLIASPALAAGSDAPTPYTVDGAGITLPAGVVFVDGGHVNVRTTAGAYGIHFESLNGQPSGRWIGASFLPWSAFGLDPATVCVQWVQLSQYNEHYGEGGQTPVGAGCTTTPTSAPTPTSTPEPSQSPTPSATPSPTPTVTEPAEPPTTAPVPQPGQAEGVGATRLAATGDSPAIWVLSAGVLAILGGTLVTSTIADRRRRPRPAPVTSPRCRDCGATEDELDTAWCFWAEEDLCSSCADDRDYQPEAGR